ncbi:hypothetical protein B1R94_02350 [Mycolicibacterium litorale]|nr:hypothetical protein B1R94_02350 [Mycolicibacterium litorale]
MTSPVGSIRVDLTIDGTSAPKELNDAVQKGLKPTVDAVSKTGSAAGSGFIKELSAAIDSGASGATSKLASHLTGSAASGIAKVGGSLGSEFMTGLTSAISSGGTGVGSALGGVTEALGGIESKAALMAAGVGLSLAGIAIGAVKVGEALYGVGKRFDAIYDGIAARTGATDDQMGQLKQSVQEVGNTTASSLESIGDVVGRVSQTIHLTGDQLDTVSKQILDFQRMTGEGFDIGGLKDVLRAFDIDSSQASDVVNKLAKVFQDTGMPVNQLEQSLAATATAAKSLGLDFDQTAGLIVSFDEAGISSVRTYEALSTAAKVFADKNIDLKTGLGDTITQLRGFVDSGNDAAAIDLAGKVFGERSAQKFVDLIREGKLTVDSLNQGLGHTGDTIGDANKKTADLAENWQIFKNRISDAAETAGGPLFDAFNKVLGVVNDIIAKPIEMPQGPSGPLPKGYAPPSVGSLLVPGYTPAPGAPGGPPPATATPAQGGPSLQDLYPALGPLAPPPPPGGWPAAPPPQDIAGAVNAKPQTDADRKKQIEAQFPLEQFLNQQPGAPGQPPMQVTVTNAMPGITAPMPSGVPFLGPGVAPASLPEGFASPSHLTPLAEQLNRIVSAQFPQIAQTGGIGGWRAHDPFPDHPSGRALDIMVGNNRALGEQINQFLQANAAQLGIQYTLWQQQTWNPGQGPKPMEDRGSPTANHMDHVHAYVQDGKGGLLPVLDGLSVPSTLGQNMYATSGPLQINPFTGQQGYFQVDQQAVWEATNARDKANFEFAKASREYAIVQEEAKQNLATESDVIEAWQKVVDAQNGVTKANADLAEKQRGGFKTAQPFDYSKLPYGDPRRVMAGILGGIGVTTGDIGAILGAAGGPIGDTFGGIASDVAGFPLPGPMGYPGTPTAPSTDLNQLATERNPLFLAQASGFNVPDYSRQGGGPNAQNLLLNGGPPNDAMGRIYSDTAALIDRTFTNLDAAEKARHDQVMAVLNEVRDKLSKDVLAPVVKQGVADGMGAMGDGVTAAIGASMGQAAAPPIASAVASAIPSSSGGGGGGNPGAALVNTAALGAANIGQAAMSVNSGGFHSFDFGQSGVFAPLPIGRGPLGNLYDEGGLWPSGTFGTNLSGADERVLDPEQTRLFDAGLLGGWNLQPLQQHQATVSGVDVSSTVGADWFGVSQVPIIGAIVNLLVAVLLKVIGVQVQARDTLNEISNDFRDFRGDFKAFDAAGRLMNDTSGLVDRTTSNEQTAADERIRIMKQVLEGLLKFIIEKIIVPIAKAVANSLINIGSQLVSGAISGGMGAAFPGGSVVGGIIGSAASSAIQAAGSATVDIVAEVGTILAESLINVGLDAIGSLFQSYLPDLSNLFFGGGLAAAIIDPISQGLTGMLGGVTMALGGLVGGLASLIPGLPFDDGGVATGIGLMAKKTIQPERVLSPGQTAAFEELPGELRALVGALQSNSLGGAPIDVGGIHIHAQQQSTLQIARDVSDYLMRKRN